MDRRTNDQALEEVFVSGKEVFHGHLINVEHWQVRLPDGKEALREVVKHRGAAAIVPVDEDGRVTLVRQHRVAIDRFTWEIPAGKLDSADEDMLVCARRELEEETGIRLSSWRYRGIVTFVSDEWGGEYMHLFTAETEKRPLPDCDEGVLAWLPWDSLTALPIWEGDKIFLRLLDEDAPFFSLKLRYQGDRLVEAVLNGKRL